MSGKSPLVRQRFRISVDIETVINAEPDETIGSYQEQVQFHQDFAQRLLAQPTLLKQLLRYYTIRELKQAEKMLTCEYTYDRTSDQQFLQPIIEKLDSAARAYFTEEIEAGVSVYYFDGYEATIKDVRLVELDEE